MDASSGDFNRPLILACSGGSNVGQMSNRLAVDLTRSGFGKMFCLAGVAAGLPGFVQSAKDAGDLIVIDGCPVACARKALEERGVDPGGYFQLTAMGMEKSKGELIPGDAEAERLAREIKQGYALHRGSAGFASSGCGCACSGGGK